MIDEDDKVTLMVKLYDSLRVIQATWPMFDTSQLNYKGRVGRNMKGVKTVRFGNQQPQADMLVPRLPDHG